MQHESEENRFSNNWIKCHDYIKKVISAYCVRSDLSDMKKIDRYNDLRFKKGRGCVWDLITVHGIKPHTGGVNAI